MPIYTGLNIVNPKQIVINNSHMNRVYVGDKLVWQKILASVGGYGLLYNWFATQDQGSTINYGYLYNWYAVIDERGIAPIGFHVPSAAEWSDLISYLGGTSIAGGKLKESGFSSWDSPNTGADNSSGFNLKGNSYRTNNGFYNGIKTIAQLWSSDLSLITPDSFPYSEMSTYIIVVNYDSGAYIYPQYRNNGAAIRFIADSGTPATAIQNDGKVLPCVTIGDQTWTAENSMETKYRNGDLIPEVTDDTEWTGLTTGARCSYSNLESNAGSTKRLAPDGWHISDSSELIILANNTGVPDEGTSGNNLKETGIIHWIIDTGLDLYGFSGRGSGFRIDSGEYYYFKQVTVFLTSTEYEWDNSYFLTAILDAHDSIFWPFHAYKKVNGNSCRLVKDDPTSWTEGDTVSDQDGNVYQTVKIGDQVWTAENWKSTKWSDGSNIEYVEGDTEWSELTTPAWCYPDGNSLNK